MLFAFLIAILIQLNCKILPNAIVFFLVLERTPPQSFIIKKNRIFWQKKYWRLEQSTGALLTCFISPWPPKDGARLDITVLIVQEEMHWLRVNLIIKNEDIFFRSLQSTQEGGWLQGHDGIPAQAKRTILKYKPKDRNTISSVYQSLNLQKSSRWIETKT